MISDQVSFCSAAKQWEWEKRSGIPGTWAFDFGRGPMKKFFALVVYLMLAICIYGQIATVTSLVGTVTDSTGRAVAGAKVTAVDTATDNRYNTVTNQDGNY